MHGEGTVYLQRLSYSKFATVIVVECPGLVTANADRSSKQLYNKHAARDQPVSSPVGRRGSVPSEDPPRATAATAAAIERDRRGQSAVEHALTSVAYVLSTREETRQQP